jgi:hypothetical protein
MGSLGPRNIGFLFLWSYVHKNNKNILEDLVLTSATSQVSCITKFELGLQGPWHGLLICLETSGADCISQRRLCVNHPQTPMMCSGYAPPAGPVTALMDGI